MGEQALLVELPDGTQVYARLSPPGGPQRDRPGGPPGARPDDPAARPDGFPDDDLLDDDFPDALADEDDDAYDDVGALGTVADRNHTVVRDLSGLGRL